ncbi:protein phosphatase [Metabacillus malikii]|uniref:Protein phosphatase n=1 Tax=Metabacillus malikii TaxID=1504265 RepID=A0ABT9ZGR2_9BACI|nr:protein phosphatase [Metabacillus malikii]
MSHQEMEETMQLIPYVRYGSWTEKGRRSENQDSLLIHLDPLVASFAVADGAGGHQFGKQASELTVSAIKSELASNTDYTPDYFQLLFKKKYEQINSYLFQESQKRNVIMATTLSMIHIFANELIVSNVGDTLIYRLRNGILERLSAIHTVAWTEYEQGKLTKEELQHHPSQHVLTKAIGAKDTIEPYYETLKTNKRDIYLLCSDGVTNFITEDRLKQLFHQLKQFTNEELTELCSTCVHEALTNDGNDNATMIAIQIV